jgi:Putative Actinobacterial Holin-X, holin superfamily III
MRASMSGRSIEGEETPEALLGQLVQELSLLLRSDLELAAAQRLPHVRRIVEELGALIGVGVALLCMLGALGWAVVRALSPILSSWRAPLVVAAGWALIATALLLLDHPRRFARRLHPGRQRAIREQTERAREEAAQAVRRTAERLAEAAIREASRHELHEATTLVERAAETGEAELGSLLRELLTAIAAPGRTGITLLERLVGTDNKR